MLPKYFHILFLIIDGNAESATGVTGWGVWSKYIHCSKLEKIVGFKLRVEGIGSGDNTALNGVQLLCEGNTESAQIKGPYGDWASEWTKCPAGEYITHVGVRGMAEQSGSLDDYGATNMKVKCSGGSELTGPNVVDKGDWTELKSCPRGKTFCGVRAKVEGDVGGGDDTALNKLQLFCCKGTLFDVLLYIKIYV